MSHQKLQALALTLRMMQGGCVKTSTHCMYLGEELADRDSTGGFHDGCLELVDGDWKCLVPGSSDEGSVKPWWELREIVTEITQPTQPSSITAITVLPIQNSP